ncbi:MAG: DUF4189 domain-containing protein [Candidatus Contendobacter sp.]
MKLRSGKPLVLMAISSFVGGCALPAKIETTVGYGAAAYAPSTQDWRLRWKAADSQRARQRALADCAAADCRVVLEFGPGECGTLALNPQGGVGAGRGATPAAAETAALDECRRVGAGCRVAQAECNE